jgi:hypothetical protein
VHRACIMFVLVASLLMLGCASDPATYSGTYESAVAGREHGTWHINLTERGDVLGVARSDVLGRDYAIVGTITGDGKITMGSGAVATGALFQGVLAPDGQDHGDWLNQQAPTLYDGTVEGGAALVALDTRSLAAGEPGGAGKVGSESAAADRGHRTEVLHIGSADNVLAVPIAPDWQEVPARKPSGRTMVLEPARPSGMPMRMIFGAASNPGGVTLESLAQGCPAGACAACEDVIKSSPHYFDAMVNVMPSAPSAARGRRVARTVR